MPAPAAERGVRRRDRDNDNSNIAKHPMNVRDSTNPKMICRLSILGICLLSLAPPDGLSAQRAIGGVQVLADAMLVVQPGVDTLAADRRAILRLLRAHANKSNSIDASTETWSRADVIDFDFGDLAKDFVTQQRATLESIDYDDATRSTQRIRLRYGPASASSVVITLYAVREAGSESPWRLSGSLAQKTRSWTRRTAGRMTFLYAPSMVPDQRRAGKASQFADSVARLFDVPAPPNILFVLTPSPVFYMHLLGLESISKGPDAQKPGSLTKRVSPTGNALVLSGDPSQAEFNKHEIAHAVLGGIFGSAFPSEGVASWLGGSYGMSRESLFATLFAFQRRNPSVSLDRLLKGAPKDIPEEEVRILRNATGALAVHEVYRRRRVAGLRGLRSLPAMAPEDWLRVQLNVSSSDPVALDRWWRAATVREVGANH